MASSGATTIPVVDLSPFFAGDDEDGAAAAAAASATEAVRQACRTHGFFRAVNHGVPAELMARAMELSAAFFALPEEEKAMVRPAVAPNDTPLPAGYGRLPAPADDKYEYMVVYNPKLGVNVYPAEPAGFRETMEECYAKLTELGMLTQEILNECMGLPAGFLENYNGDRSFDHMTAKCYFPAVAEDNSGLGEHEDSNCITFIFQDSVGGLEVLKDGQWVPAEPVEGSIIVNVGDVMQVLSNKKLKSATHRVVRKPVHRHSIAYFFSVHGDQWVEPLPEFTAKIGETPRYRGFRYKEYQRQRIRNKTHPPARPEDIVRITHYAI
ncbi:hypothetical protein ACP4OV_026162 [Aristida adscensionis]